VVVVFGVESAGSWTEEAADKLLANTGRRAMCLYLH
jgi:hypothetical protein